MNRWPEQLASITKQRAGYKYKRLKHTPEVAADATMVFEKMKSTLSVRRNMVNAETPAANILKEFPQFQITPGEIEQDFRLMFPNEHPKLLERWPSIKQKIIALARKSTDGATAELLATVDRGPCEDLELRSIYSGCSIDAFLEKNTTAMQPYLLALGPTKKSISQYFIVVDHIALPCPARDALGAFDVLFKSHYVFGLHYSKHLLNFWTFLQTTIYQIGITNTHQTPRARTLRSKLQL
ncbi:hypothetical protein HOLleu_01001 [Holothuria leucospilota]|uniref:Uncharacterized protein n=1 Tax=Holothuria leucospilota TaxID=206669 RepID=A0A9Q1CQF5_HOLLE|nr:hypothetical protein HOLleu_01001 [Holothuria leucospilota]